MSPADMLRLTLPLLLSVPAAGLVSLPSSSRGLVPHRSSPLYLSTSAAAKIMFDRSSCCSSGGGISLPSAKTGWPRRAQRLQRGTKSIKHPLLSGWGLGVVCGAGGDSNGGDDESSGRRDDDSERGNNDGANSAPKDEGSLMAEKQGANSTGDGDDSLQKPALSVSALEDELQARAAQKAATTRRDGARSGGGAADEGEDAWLPRFFPPPLPGQDDGEGDAIQPLIELPLDGILLQLFPALLIGVLGLFLTVAIQVEAGRFDGMVGEDGGAVVVTDLRDTRTQEQP